MTKAEQAMADLQAKHDSVEEVGQKRKARERAAREWVAHFNSVLDLVESTDSEIATEDELVHLLVGSWELKADGKDEKLVNRLAGIRPAKTEPTEPSGSFGEAA